MNHYSKNDFVLLVNSTGQISKPVVEHDKDILSKTTKGNSMKLIIMLKFGLTPFQCCVPLFEVINYTKLMYCVETKSFIRYSAVLSKYILVHWYNSKVILILCKINVIINKRNGIIPQVIGIFSIHDYYYQ